MRAGPAHLGDNGPGNYVTRSQLSVIAPPPRSQRPPSRAMPRRAGSEARPPTGSRWDRNCTNSISLISAPARYAIATRLPPLLRQSSLVVCLVDSAKAARREQHSFGRGPGLVGPVRRRIPARL